MEEVSIWWYHSRWRLRRDPSISLIRNRPFTRRGASSRLAVSLSPASRCRRSRSDGAAADHRVAAARDRAMSAAVRRRQPRRRMDRLAGASDQRPARRDRHRRRRARPGRRRLRSPPRHSPGWPSRCSGARRARGERGEQRPLTARSTSMRSTGRGPHVLYGQPAQPGASIVTGVSRTIGVCHTCNGPYSPPGVPVNVTVTVCEDAG